MPRSKRGKWLPPKSGTNNNTESTINTVTISTQGSTAVPAPSVAANPPPTKPSKQQAKTYNTQRSLARPPAVAANVFKPPRTRSASQGILTRSSKKK